MPHLGLGRSIQDIEAARLNLEKLYHDRGYKTVLVSIPQQQVHDGVVHLHVTEAAVGQLHIEGSRFHSLEGIRGKLTQLNEGSVPQFGEVQKQLADVNHTADLRVTPVLKASQTPGKVDVDLKVADTLPLHASLEVNNRYSANTAHARVVGELRYDNLFQAGQSISLQYQTAPDHPQDAKVGSLSYVMPLEANRVLALYAVHSDSQVAAVGELDVIGKGNIFGARWIAPLPTASREFYHSFTAGADYKDLKQNVHLGGKDCASDFNSANCNVLSPASYPEFTLLYSGTWLGPGGSGAGIPATLGRRSSTTFDVGVNFTLRGLATERMQFADKRAGASTEFATLRPGLTREQLLPGAFSLVGRLEGQIASGPLLNNEEFAGGGAESVRGYTEAERLADNGFRASLELRTPQLLMPHWQRAERAYLLVFFDGAHLRVIDPQPQQQVTYTLESAGFGLRFKDAGLMLNLDGARILKSGSVTPADRYRGLFQVAYSY